MLEEPKHRPSIATSMQELSSQKDTARAGTDEDGILTTTAHGGEATMDGSGSRVRHTPTATTRTEQTHASATLGHP